MLVLFDKLTDYANRRQLFVRAAVERAIRKDLTKQVHLKQYDKGEKAMRKSLAPMFREQIQSARKELSKLSGKSISIKHSTPFPESIRLEAFERSGGRCECTRNHLDHESPSSRCSKTFKYEDTSWAAHHVISTNQGRVDQLSNCEIICTECHGWVKPAKNKMVSDAAANLVAQIFRPQDWDEELQKRAAKPLTDSMATAAIAQRKLLPAKPPSQAGRKDPEITITTTMPTAMQQAVEDQLAAIFEQDYWSDINTTTANQLGTFLTTSLEQGLSINEIVANMGDAFPDTWSEGRATTIARTEMGNALNAGRRAGIDDAKSTLEPEVKVIVSWLSILGTTTRDAHADLDGVEENSEGMWDLVGYSVPWPGHFSLPPEHRNNCQCSLNTEYKSVEPGTVIPESSTITEDEIEPIEEDEFVLPPYEPTELEQELIDNEIVGPNGETRAELREALGVDNYWGGENQPFYRPGPNYTVDLVTNRIDPETGEVQTLMIQRADNAATEGGKWAIPGGFQDSDAPKGSPFTHDKESALDAAVRELSEETGLDVEQVRANIVEVGQFGSPDGPSGRDPRDNSEAWAVTTAYRLDLSSSDIGLNSVQGMDDAQNAAWLTATEIANQNVAFDHSDILTAASNTGIDEPS